MLTLANTNTTQAKNYYKKENYYSQQDAEVNSQWQGQGASKYQLSGAIVDLDIYENIVNGLSPDGKTQLRQKQNHNGKKERAGTDLTFSAPKSVSIACLVGGDTRLEEAHRIAVTRTIDLIESRYAQTRINGQVVQTGNLIVAKWHHDTSRELDPHLHTHCLIMNCTQGPDGKWRTISNKAFYQNKILLGQIYRNELAIECRKLGYEIELHPKELFEIKGYTREQIEGFSKRHEQIKGKLIEMGAELTTENKIWAWRKTRAKKNHEIGRDEKLPYWHEEADLYSINHPVPQKVVESVSNEAIDKAIQSAVSVGIEHCSERQVAFKSEDIEKFVTAEVKPFSIHQLEKAIAQHPELIKTFDGRYTTQAALSREIATIKLMQQGKKRVSPIADLEAIESYLDGKKLTLGQHNAIALTATTCDQFIAWQGVAGAGKTYALNEVKQIATALQDIAPGYTIKGFAPSAQAAKVLGEELGIEANTVARLLVSKQEAQIKSNQIWIVDEAGLLSANNAHSLLQRATEEGARVILVGDTRQLSAIEAGNPFRSLQSAGIATAYLDESLRQKPPDLQKAVGLAAAGQPREAISHLQKLERIEEIADATERIAKIAADYIKLLPKERQQTLIVAGTHKERSAITQQIRTALKEEGTLGYGVEVTQLRARQTLTAVQTRYTHNYNVGDVVVPIREYKKLGLHKSQPYTVEAIAGDKLHLQDLAGNQLVVDPMKFRKTLYQQETIDIAVGEVLRWTRNDKELGRRNGQGFTVIGIDGQTATIELENGKTNTIDLYGPLHLDHALVATTYSSQGKTANRVMVSSTVDLTVSQESVYVAISRAKYDLKIYAENVEFLLEQSQESKAQETVLELLQPQAKGMVAAEPVVAVKQNVEVSADLGEKPELRYEKPRTSIEEPIKQSRGHSKVRPVHKKEPPKQLEVFWTPICDYSSPPHIEEKHWQELVESSAIHPDIAALNFRSLQMGSIEQEHQAWEYLMYSDKLERTNTGQLTTGMLKRYTHIESGGWWCDSGVNAVSFPSLELQTKPQEKIWGCYKPNEPRANPDKPGKKIKYEHPPKTDLGIFLLKVPDNIAERIYKKADIEPSQEERTRGFWYCVWKYNLPVIMTEGAKKAASLLSQGHAAIGLPGIYAGYRSKDEQGNPIKAHLHEELATFATLGREITFCFDFETRPDTKRNIDIAISRTGSLLRQQGAKVSVVTLLGPEKGVDDLIVARSPLAFEQQLSAALPLKQWREQNKHKGRIEVSPPQKLTIAQRRERLKESSLGQPPINTQNLNQSQEQIYDDIEQRQLSPEYTNDRHQDNNQLHNAVDQENRTIGEKQQPVDYENRATREQQQAVERTNPTPGDCSDREPERIESESIELLAAISQYLELQEVEQLGANIAELNRSLAIGWLRGQGTAFLSGVLDRQDSRVTNYAASDESIERHGGDNERTTRQLVNEITADTALNAITNYLEIEAIQSTATPQDLQTLIQNLKNYQPQGLNEVIRKLDAVLPSLIEQLNQDPNSSIEQQAYSQAIEAIDDFVKVQIIEDASIAQSVIPLTQQLAGLQNQGLTSTIEQLASAIEEAISFHTRQKVVNQTQSAIANHTEQSAIDSAITQPLTDLTQQLGQQQALGANLIEQLDSVISSYLAELKAIAARLEQKTNEQAIRALSSYVAHEAITNLQVIPAVIEKLTTDLQSERSHSTQALNGLNFIISSHLEQTKATFARYKQQLVTDAVESLVECVDQSVVESVPITQAFKQIKENLSMLQTANNTEVIKKLNPVITAYKKETVATLAQQLREIPLDEIANRLGLVLDKHDKHKWWDEGQIVSINDQKFYDHLNLKGGYGAIDLVMHVQGSDFKEALQWLADGMSKLPLAPVRSHEPKAKERQPFQSPIPDESKWLAVRQYLIEKRQLPTALVDALHNQGKVYADRKQNAVFVRQDAEDNITGASLRGTYDSSSFKGLATGSRRDAGWFSFVQGEGLLKRIVLVESSIDAISAAAIATQGGATRFIATDGAGALPIKFLQLHQGAGIQIIAAHDCDRAGEEMAWQLAMEISSVTRATPTYGKDWNEQLKDVASKLDSSQWKLVAQAIGKSDAYVSRIVAVVDSGQPLPVEASVAMQQDFAAYKQLSSDLWQWHQAARSSGYSEAYLKRIAEVAISLHHPKMPNPLSESALNAMQQDIDNYNQISCSDYRSQSRRGRT